MSAQASTRPRFSGPGPHGMAASLEKPKDFKASLRKVLGYLRPYRFRLVLVACFAVASTVFNIFGPKVLSLATTLVFDGAAARLAGTGSIDFAAVLRVLVSVLLLYLASGACAFVQSFVMASVSQRVSYTLRRDLVAKIDRMPFAYFERNQTGDVLSRISNDVDTLGTTLSQGLTTLVTALITFFGVLFMMLSISPLLTAIAFFMLPLAFLLVRFVVKRSQGYFRTQQEYLGKVNAQVEECFSGHSVVRAFCQEQRSVDSFSGTSETLYESAWKSQFISSLMMPVMNFISNAGYVFVAVVGGYLALQRVITVGDIQAFIHYVREFTRPIQQLSQVANVLQAMTAAAERVFEFLDEDEIGDSPALSALAHATGDVRFESVRFGYDSSVPVIKGFTAHVKPGQTVALVGPTGSGKTTMVKLLMRFYDLDEGAIFLDGRDIATLDRNALRAQFAMVLQDTWLFSGSIRDNIAYGKLDATDEEIEAAARAARVHWFVSTLPGGYDFEVNEDASNLSAGQRQLLTIARAILADRPMLILDEATSSVDTRTERLIQLSTDELMKGRTSFVIAHRLSTIRDADLILCLHDGDIVEQGSHEELLALGGFYAELYNAQFNM